MKISNIKIVAATDNKHKIKEIEAVTSGFGMKIITKDEAGAGGLDVEETGKSFEENSKLKANAISSATGLAAIADDSGLEVDALDGAPGIYSARFSGENATDDENNRKLLELLADLPDGERTARFVCVITLVFTDGRSIIARGECNGKILRELRGENGFGYDPLFMPDGFDRSFAQLSSEEKNLISHRAVALKKLQEHLNLL